MYMMSLMAWIASTNQIHQNDPSFKPLCPNRCIKISLVHDIAESLVGDIAPSDNVTKEEKRYRESQAIQTLSNSLHNSSFAEEMLQLWKEYEYGTTEEALLVKEIDKLEMALQAFVYEKAGTPLAALDQSNDTKNTAGQEASDHDKTETIPTVDLTDFYFSVAGKISHPLLISWWQELLSRRQSLFPGLSHIDYK